MWKVRLLRDAGLGVAAGGTVQVSAGYARTYLIPNGFAERVVEEKFDEWAPAKLSDAEQLDKEIVLKEFRRQMYHGGIRKWSINGLNRTFDRVDTESKDETLDRVEFQEAINKFGVFLDERSTSTLFRVFDRNNNGRIDYKEFISGLRLPMNERRFLIVSKAWDSLPKTFSESAEKSAIIDSTDAHVNVETGVDEAETVKRVISGELARWSDDAELVDKDAFYNHFTDLSAGIDSDEAFVHLVVKQFNVSENNDVDEQRAAVQAFKDALREKLEQKSLRTSDISRQLLKAFQFVNSDSMGGIMISEFRVTMERIGLSGNQVDTVFNIFDKSGNQMIDYQEFAQEMAQ